MRRQTCKTKYNGTDDLQVGTMDFRRRTNDALLMVGRFFPLSSGGVLLSSVDDSPLSLEDSDLVVSVSVVLLWDLDGCDELNEAKSRMR